MSGRRARFGHAAVVGTGLIGGALGMALRRGGLARRVTAVDRDPTAAVRAVERGAADAATSDLREAADAQIVFVAVPLEQIVAVCKALLSYLPAGTILTDVGSVKAPIVASVERLAPPVRFVGGHPMAGSEGAGIEAADPDFLRGRPYVLTPTGFTDRQAVSELAEVVRAIGMTPVVMQPEVHDRLAALISHAPYLVACAVVLSAGDEPESFRMAGPAFEDLSRMARNPVAMWDAITRMNRDEVVRALRGVRARLDEIEDGIAQDALRPLLERAHHLGRTVERNR
ncbi:MAG: prephenate dehydrogenase/arogenate dehydrogenase family protein [Armatimonadota bacterium]|nr:prephenate dehydrogenase/arogenate dehydrogenase family protein [Armatimonadota bacterium]MDR5696610.1 prephenate dehydrogenase/arogenate dehydrogenase family protein [Armatimonadota bacterium]